MAVPLDDRPVNFQALAQLGEVAGLELALPPRELLGRFRTPGQPGALLEWLGTALPGADGAVLSLDMLCYGGLVASRTDAVTEAVALARVEALEALLARTGVPAAATSVLLRQSTTVFDAASLRRWRRLFELMGLPDDRRAAALRAEHDPAMAAEIERHLRCRRRNHAVNRAALELAERGALAYAAILKEDCSPEGIHRVEEAELLALRTRLGVEARSCLQPGADEGGMMMLARLALAAHRVHPAISVEYLPAQLADTVPLYEDRPLARTVAAQVAACGLTVRADADLRLSVVAAGAPGRDLFVAAPHAAARPDAAWPDATEVAARLLRGEGASWQTEVEVRAPQAPDRPPARGLRGVAAAVAFGTRPEGDRVTRFWGIADVTCANGADPALAEQLLSTGLARRAAAFAAWNTAANACGSALAHLAALACPGDNPAARERYRLTRWAEDYVYQALVRPEVVAAARNPYDFGDQGDALAELLERRMREECQRRLGIRLRHGASPWRRAFEVEVTA